MKYQKPIDPTNTPQFTNPTVNAVLYDAEQVDQIVTDLQALADKYQPGTNMHTALQTAAQACEKATTMLERHADNL